MKSLVGDSGWNTEDTNAVSKADSEDEAQEVSDGKDFTDNWDNRSVLYSGKKIIYILSMS